MQTIRRIGFTIIAIPTIILLTTTLLDKIVTREVIEAIRNIMQSVDYIIGTRATNLILMLISLGMFIMVIKWLGRLIQGEKDDK